MKFPKDSIVLVKSARNKDHHSSYDWKFAIVQKEHNGAYLLKFLTDWHQLELGWFKECNLQLVNNNLIKLIYK